MDNAETSLREIMVALLALGPASGPDQAAMRKAIGQLLQSPPDEEKLSKAWRKVRGALEDLQAPAPQPGPLTAEDQEQRLRKAWDMFADGEHANPDADFPDGKDGVVTALTELDRKGEPAAKETLSRSAMKLKVGVAPSPPDGWAAVEFAALIPGQKPKTKWDMRAMALKALAPVAEGAGWIERMTEARRRLLRGEALGRSFGIQFSDIGAELDDASRRFSALGEPYGVGLAELVRGRAYAWRGQLMEASEALSAALVAFVDLGNTFRLSDTAYELGAAYRELHRFEAARKVQAQNIALEIKRGQVDSLTRSMQSYAMTHINEARLGPNGTEEERKARTRLLAKARVLSWRAFEMVKTRSEAAPEGAPSVPAGEGPTDLPEIIGKQANDYRATICARDLAEIALLEGNDDLARRWLERAKLESGAITKAGQSMVDAFVMPAFQAVGNLDPEEARRKLTEGTKFELVRLAEIELRLPSLEQRPAMERAKDLDLVARAWDMQKLPAYAIEAWLNAADTVSTREAAPKETETQAGLHWRYLALKRAESVGAVTHTLAAAKSPVVMSPPEAAAAAAAKASVLHLIDARSEARLFRVRGFDAIGGARLLVSSSAPDNWAEVSRKLAAVSRERAGVPRIERFGAVDGAAWVMDEEIEGPTLAMAMRVQMPATRVLRMLAELGDTVQALLSTGLKAVWLDVNEIIVAPGDKLVIRRYGDLFLGPHPTTAIKGVQGNDVALFVGLARTWLEKSTGFDGRHRSLLDDIDRYQKQVKQAEYREALTVIATRFKDLADRDPKA